MTTQRFGSNSTRTYEPLRSVWSLNPVSLVVVVRNYLSHFCVTFSFLAKTTVTVDWTDCGIINKRSRRINGQSSSPCRLYPDRAKCLNPPSPLQSKSKNFYKVRYIWFNSPANFTGKSEQPKLIAVVFGCRCW